MYGILDRYVGKNIIFYVLIISVCLTLFATLIGLIDSLRYIGRGHIDFMFVVEYNLYKLPGILVTFFPVSILIGGVIGLGSMAKNSEIVILQSIGLSKLNIGISCTKSLIPVIAVIMVLGEVVTPKLDKLAEERYSMESSGLGVSFTNSGTWFKEGNTFIGLGSIYDKKVLMNLIRYEYDGNNLIRYSTAKSGVYENGKWVMKDVVEKTINDESVTSKNYETQNWELNINSDRIDVLSDISSNMSVWKLSDYINYLEQNGVDSTRYRLYFYSKIVSPAVMLVMLLLALSTIFGPLRSMNMSARVISGIALGFGFYVLNQIVAPFSLVYGVPPVIGATFATVVFAALAFYLLRRKS